MKTHRNGFQKLWRSTKSKVGVGILSASLALAPSQAFSKPLEEIIATSKVENVLEPNKGEIINYLLNDDTTSTDLNLFESYAQDQLFGGLGETANSIMRLMWPEIPGTRRVMFIPAYGQNKVHNKKIKWQENETKHFKVLNYNPDNFLAQHALDVLENEFEKLQQKLNFSAFPEKLEYHLFNSRQDYQQSSVLPLPWLEASGGVTMPSKGMMMAMPFNGSQERFDEVTAHELFHAYSISTASHYGGLDSMKNLPQWWVEGSAENWGERGLKTQTQQVLKDMLLNAPMFNIAMVERFGFHPLTYKFGSWITQVIKEEFGEEKVGEIYKRSSLPFDQNLQLSIGINKEELFNLAQTRLEQRYGHLTEKIDITDTANFVSEDHVVAAYHENFATVEFEDKRLRLKLNSLNRDHGRIISEVVADSGLGNRRISGSDRGSIGVDLDDKLLVYVMTNNVDELRLQPFNYKDGEFNLKDDQSYHFEGIHKIMNPAIVDKDQIAFIGIADKYTDIYLFNTKDKKLEQLTNDKNYYSGLDSVNGNLVFSKEEINDKHLHIMNLSNRKTKQITHGKSSDNNPRFSQDGENVLFESDENGTNNLYNYKLRSGKREQLTDVRVGLRNPQWIDNDNIMFNGVKLFGSKLYTTKLPNEEMLRRISIINSMPCKGPHYTLEKDKLELVGEVKKTKVIEIDGPLITEEGKLKFEDGKETYKVLRMIPLEDRLILQTVPERKKMISYDIKFYELKKGKLEKPGLEHFLSNNKQIKNKLEETRKKFTVVAEKLSFNEDYLFILTNNKLSLQESKHPMSLHVLDTNTLNQWEFLKLDGMTNTLDAVKSIANKKILFVNKVNEEGEAEKYGIFNLEDGTKKDIFDGTLSNLSLSENRRYIAASQKSFWKSEAGIAIYDSVNNKDKTFYLGIDKDNFVNLDFFTEDEMFVAEQNDHLLTLHLLRMLDINKGEIKRKKIDLQINGKILNVKSNGRYAALVMQNDQTNPNLLFADLSNGNVKDISEDGVHFENLRFVGDTLIYQSRDLTNGINLKTYMGEKPRNVQKAKLSKHHLTFYDGREVLDYNLENGKLTKISNNSFGFDTVGENVVVSEPSKEKYRVRFKNVSSGEVREIGEGYLPEIQDDVLVFQHYKNGKHGFSTVNMYTIDDLIITDEPTIFQDENFDLGNVIIRDEKVYFSAREIKEGMIKKEKLENLPNITSKINKVSILPFDKFSLHGIAAAAWIPGSNFYGWVDARFMASDKPGDHLLLGGLTTDFNSFALINTSYLDLPKEWGANLYGNHYVRYTTIGANASKIFPISKYQRLSFFGGYEFQDHILRENNHVITAGNSYAIDTSQWDVHGPVLGERIFAKLSSGFSVNHKDLSNVDLNVDARKYFYFAPKIGAAFRVAAGTSQGANPTSFIMGGTDDVRGAPLFGLYGNNYYMGIAEMRLPLAQFAGAILPEPLTPASIVTGGIDVRGKLFTSISDVFYNQDINKGLVNVPDIAAGLGIDFYYLGGIRLSFAYTAYGKIDPPGRKDKFGWNKGWNFWMIMPNW